MKASIEWMKDYVSINGDLQKLADDLTQAGIPVEEVNSLDLGIKKVYTGKIIEIERHPDADKLVVCQLECLTPEGEPEIKQIVTGATNVKVGQIVPVAYHKSKLPDKSISRGKLRGVMSDGMLCSINELGYSKELFLPEEADGIYILPEDTKIGLDIKDVMMLNDTVYTFELTPNRADCFSMIGLSREFAALTNQEAKLPDIKVIEDSESVKDQLKISIEDSSLCSRFMGRLIKNVKIQPSPQWMQNRLRNAGVRPINNIVDVTNYVMIEFGQPMHAYDYDKLQGHELVARLAKKDEKLTTLDKEVRELNEEMLIIADAKNPVGIAGVMGGYDSEVTADTVNIVLEAAVFYGKSIRRTSRQLGLRSEASGRFERGVNAAFTPLALDRATQLIQEICPSAKICAGVVDVYPQEKESRTVSFTTKAINEYLGTNIADDTIKEILNSLHFKIAVENDVWTATIPSWRDDVAFMCDIAEEVARIYSYNNITPTTPVAHLTSGVKSPMRQLQQQVNNYLVQAGLNECITFSFMHKDSLKNLLLPDNDGRYEAVPILNPISEEFPFMRTSLVPSILETAKKNIFKKNYDLALFEQAAVYEPKALPLEDFVNHRQMVAGILIGEKYSPNWPAVKAQYDFYDLKGIVEGLFKELGLLEYEIERGSETYLHPGISAKFVSADKVLASFGKLHPQVSKNYDLPENSYIFEIDLEAILHVTKSSIKFQAISKFPGVKRDLAILASKATSNATIVNLIKENGGEFLTDVYLFDVYEGEHIQEGFRSMAYNLSFQAMEKTLEDKDVDEPIAQIIAKLSEINCSLR